MHYGKLILRSLLFLGVLALYVWDGLKGRQPLERMGRPHWLLAVIWLLFAVEMVLRFFPARVESMGCRKQFARSFRPSGHVSAEPPARLHRGVGWTLLSWAALNGAIGGLYGAGVLDRGMLLLISLAYSVCDMICILFFCPFQSWFLKNKCCTTCRIYNWDYAMMFTPMAFCGHWYGWSLLGLGLALMVQWELLVLLHPERFAESHNQSLSCACCTEHLCQHKKQLHRFWAGHRALFARGIPGRSPHEPS